MLYFEDLFDGDLGIYCPKCGSKDIAIELKGGFFCFNKCNKCGHETKQGCFVED